MNFDTTYVLEDAMSRGSMRVDPCNLGIDYVSLFLGDYLPSSVVEYRQSSKACRHDDLIGSSDAVSRIMSERTIDALDASGCTGWRKYEIKLEDADGRSIQGYSGIQIVGRSGPIDPSRARNGVIRMEGGVEYPSRLGLYFDTETWDGSDVFCPIGTTLFLVTNKVKTVIDELACTNVQLTSLAEAECLIAS